MNKVIGLCIAGSLLALSCNNRQKDENPKTDILSAHLDTTINPAGDFFDYANGAWIRQNPIPDAYKSWGIGYLVQDDLYNRLKVINEQAAAKKNDPAAQKIALFWASGMDTAIVDKTGVEALAAEWTLIDAIRTKEDLLDAVAVLNTKGIGPMFAAYIAQDDKNSASMALYLGQGGLGLPNRDYYFNTDERTVKIREAYPGHIRNILRLSGMDEVQAKTQSASIFSLEKKLAASSRKLEDLRDPYANYHKFSVASLTQVTPGIQWKDWLLKAGIRQVDSVIIGQPEFFRTLDELIRSESLATWQNYLKWTVANEMAPYLNKDFQNEDFAFYGQILSGLKAQKVRWKRVLDQEERAMGEALGQLFVKEYFPEKAKMRYENLVEDIRSALKERIKALDWMSPETKEKALDKLAKMRKKVGYPDKWKDFSTMEIKEQPYARNVIAAKEWWHRYEVNKLGKPVDRDEWGMTPQTYNAYYNPSNNEIVLPAGIFTVPGYRDEDLDDALVYGYAAASTIGHEITHGFDDQGRQYDAEGNLKNWWTKEDEQKFDARAAVMVQQFDHYIPVDSLHINGKATLGENIADLGGVLLGWDAFSKTGTFKEGRKIGGLTPQQRYFLGYALGWLYHARKESLAQQVMTDVHSPAKYRVNGPFSDVDAFYQVFHVQPGDGMYIPDSLRVRIW